MTSEMELVVDAGGDVRCIYDEALDLRELGKLQIVRASHVEPDAEGYWWADMLPVHGPVLGPFRSRSEALGAEREWLALSKTGLRVVPHAARPARHLATSHNANTPQSHHLSLPGLHLRRRHFSTPFYVDHAHSLPLMDLSCLPIISWLAAASWFFSTSHTAGPQATTLRHACSSMPT